MRSRDGNHNSLFAVCSLLIFCSLALNAGEYLISYRYVVKDLILYNESLQISKSMTKCSGISKSFIELEYKNSKNLNKIILDNSDEFINYLYEIGLNVKYNGLTTNAINSSSTIITLKTTCFKVDFNDYFVRIAALK